MILENQGQTTLEKYLCKFVEFVLFDSSESSMSSAQISSQIEQMFQLSFDIHEIEKAIKNKGKDRIVSSDRLYSLHPKICNQLAMKSNHIDQL
jgi:hypothetical protein